MLARSLTHVSILPLIVAAALNGLALLLQAARWQAVLQPAGPAPRFASTFFALLSGFAASLILPARGGEFVRVEYLARRSSLDRGTLIGSLAADHLVNGVTLVLLSLGLFAVPTPAWIRASLAALVPLLLVMLGISFLVAREPSTAPTHGWRTILLHLAAGLIGLRRPRTLAIATVWALAGWLVELTTTALALKAFGVDIGVAGTLIVLLALNLALIVPSPPGNVGTFEVGTVLALVSLGVPRESAIAAAVGFHLVHVIPVALAGALLSVAPTRSRDPIPL